MAFQMRNMLGISARLVSESSFLRGKHATGYCRKNFSITRLLRTLNATDLYDSFENDDMEDLRKKHRTEATNVHGSSRKFSEFNLKPKLLEKLEDLGYIEPFEIQTQTLGHTLNGKNVIGRAITGSGKTLAFALPIVQKIMDSADSERKSGCPKAILISPTRELCNQIYKSIQELSSSVKCVALYGGASITRQYQEINRGVDVICATPGRLNDHIERGTISLEDLKFLCLDEADELLNPNFKEQIEDILQNSPADKQVMLFSATMPADIRDVIRRFMPDPEYVDITTGQKYKSPESIEHGRIEAPRKMHLPTLCCLLKEHQPERCIVFLRTKEQTRRTSDLIRDARMQNIRSQFINSDLSQSRRETVIKYFRTGKFNVLCATDVAARGLDIPEVDLIIQVEPPANGTDYYIHRSGRTGRAGRSGTSIMIHSNTRQEQNVIDEIEMAVPLKKLQVPDGTEEMLSELQEVSSTNLMAYEISNPYPEKGQFKKKSNYMPRSRFSYNNNNSRRSFPDFPYREARDGSRGRHRDNRRYRDDNESEWY